MWALKREIFEVLTSSPASQYEKVEKPVRKKRAPIKERLEKIGLSREWDFVLHLPLRYEDKTQITSIADAQPEQTVLIEGVVTDSHEQVFAKRFEAVVEDETGSIQVKFFKYFPSVKDTFKPGNKILLFGKVKSAWKGDGLEIIHPKSKISRPTRELDKSLTPVYPAGEGITQPWLRKRIQTALLNVDIIDLLNAEELRELNLPPLRKAIESIHYPAPDANLEELQMKTSPGWKRLKFDELLAQQIMLTLSRKRREALKAPEIVPPEDKEGSLTGKLYRSLPFKLTKAQVKVWKEIVKSMKGPIPMNRLVQGDVGSGKTIIAAMSAALTIDNGYQAALMAPTEILAEQHFKKILEWLKPFDVKVVWLTGKLKAKEKREALERIASDADIVVGTHALIQDAVQYKNLGLAIVDEQHRFGVEQRLALRALGASGLMPHLLMLSATPIPRTLAMSYLSDIDISVIDELPPGRTPINTKTFKLERKQEIIESVRQELRNGRQAYWVCPLIEESEKLDLTAATISFEELKQSLTEFKVELLHGKMTSEEKNEIMERFKSGKTSLLVSTTVIEVGVDVPNATIMVIEHSERFGLSQLHQLRGRVGRGSKASYCIALFGDKLSQEGKQRLKIFRETTDGFVIAKKDLELRGPGEFLGSRQSGVPLLRFANFDQDSELVDKAKELAIKWISSNDARAETHASRWFESKEKYLEA